MFSSVFHVKHLFLQPYCHEHVSFKGSIESPEALIFEMNDCRVQSARVRKGLADYPCKSAGLVEYARFAEAIDDRIRTECIGCPPDAHPAEWFCAWKFTIIEKEANCL